MTARDFSKTPAELIGVEDPVEALAFNAAASLRLFRFDNEKDEANREFWKELVMGTGGEGV